MKKTILISISVILTIVAIELMLRFAGYVILRYNFSAPFLEAKDSHEHAILCLGDSFTQGSGAINGYPEQLEKLLNSGPGREKFRVINLGRSSSNTTQVFETLSKHIDTIRPELVIIMVGINNWWNLYGYHSFVKSSDVFSKCKDILWKLRIYKLIVFAHKTFKESILKHKSPYSGRIRKRTEERVQENSNISDNTAPKKRGGTNKNNEPPPAETSTYYAKLGDDRFTKNKTDDALRFYFKSLEVDAADPSVHRRIGTVFHKSNDFKKAEEWYKKAIKVDPSNSDSYCWLAGLYSDYGLTDKSIKLFEKAIEIDPSGNQGNAYGKLGYLHYFLFGDKIKAFDYYKKAIINGPEERCNYTGFVKLCKELDMMDEGKQFLKRIAKNSSFAMNHLALIQEGEPEENVYRWMKYDIARIAKLCDRKDAKILIINYPQDCLYNLFDYSSTLSVPTVDIFKLFSDLFKSGGKEEYLVPDGHCNDKGYFVIAKALFDKITADKTLGFKNKFN